MLLLALLFVPNVLLVNSRSLLVKDHVMSVPLVPIAKLDPRHVSLVQQVTSLLQVLQNVALALMVRAVMWPSKSVIHVFLEPSPCLVPASVHNVQQVCIRRNMVLLHVVTALQVKLV